MSISMNIVQCERPHLTIGVLHAKYNLTLDLMLPNHV